jgi:hypothetical protein
VPLTKMLRQLPDLETARGPIAVTLYGVGPRKRRVGVWVSLGSYDLAQSGDLNFLPDHLMAVIGYVQPNRATLKLLGAGVVEMTTLRLWLKRMVYQRVLATTSDRIPDSPR